MLNKEPCSPNSAFLNAVILGGENYIEFLRPCSPMNDYPNLASDSLAPPPRFIEECRPPILGRLCYELLSLATPLADSIM